MTKTSDFKVNQNLPKKKRENSERNMFLLEKKQAAIDIKLLKDCKVFLSVVKRAILASFHYRLINLGDKK